MPQLYCAIANMGIKNIKPVEVIQVLMNKCKIHIVTINWEAVHAVRITSHVYTPSKYFNRLVMAIKSIAV
jgi:hypothetical protein